MLVCFNSLRPPRVTRTVEIAETAVAEDTLSSGAVFDAIIDDPASAGEASILDAYVGEIMLEAASAADNPAEYVPPTTLGTMPMLLPFDSGQFDSTNNYIQMTKPTGIQNGMLQIAYFQARMTSATFSDITITGTGWTMGDKMVSDPAWCSGWAWRVEDGTGTMPKFTPVQTGGSGTAYCQAQLCEVHNADQPGSSSTAGSGSSAGTSATIPALSLAVPNGVVLAFLGGSSVNQNMNGTSNSSPPSNFTAIGQQAGGLGSFGCSYQAVSGSTSAAGAKTITSDLWHSMAVEARHNYATYATPPRFRQTDGWANGSTSVTSKAATLPISPTTGDLLIAIISVHAGSKTIATSTTGWTMGDQQAGASFSSGWAWAIQAPGLSAPTFTWTGSANARVRVYEFGNVNASPIGTVANSSGSGTSVSQSGITTTADSSYVLGLVITLADGQGPFWRTYPYQSMGSYMLFGSSNTAGAPGNVDGYGSDEMGGYVKYAAGAAPTMTLTLLASDTWHSFLIEVKAV